MRIESTPTSSVKQRYLKWVYNQTSILKTKGLLPKQNLSMSPIDIGLSEIYVPLRICKIKPLEEKTSEKKCEINNSNPLSNSSNINPANINKADFRESRDESEPFIKNDNTTFPITVLLKERKSVLIGGVGSGKTTFVYHTANELCKSSMESDDNESMPLIIAFRDITRQEINFEFDNIEYFYKNLVDSSILDGDERVTEFFISNLLKGNFVIFFDGLDEVSSPSLRTKTTEWVHNVVEKYSANRFIVTSRPTGYSQGPLNSEFSLFKIANFNNLQIKQFIEQWFPLIESRVRNDSEFVEIDSQREIKGILTALSQKKEIRDLAQNPLLLTLIVIVHRYRGKLPDRRVELYSECMSLLLSYWPAERKREHDIPLRSSMFVLKTIAFKLHAKGLRDINYNQLLLMLEEPMQIVLPEMNTAYFLNEICSNSMVMEERGIGVYGFFHLSFQEYLTACYLRDNNLYNILIEKLNWTNGKVRNWWHEVALLYCGMDHDVNPFLNAFIQKEDDQYLSNFFLICECIAEYNATNSKLKSFVIDSIFNSIMGDKGDYIKNTSIKALHFFHNDLYSIELVPKLISSINSTHRKDAIAALSNLANDKALDVLLEIIDSSENRDEIGNIAVALGEIGNPKAFNTLKKQIRRFDDEFTILQIASAMVQIDRSQTISELIKIMKETSDLSKLVIIGDLLAYSRVDDPIIDFMKQSIDDKIIGSISWSLGLSKNSEAINFLIEEFNNAKQYDKIEELAMALGRNSSKIAIDSLLNRLGTAEDESLVRSIVGALGITGDVRALDAILALIGKFTEEDTIVSIVWALGLSRNEKALEGLMHLLKTTDSENIRKNIIQSIGLIVKNGYEDLIIDQIEKATEPDTISTIAWVLGKCGGQKSLDALNKLFEIEKNIENFGKICYAIGRIGSEKGLNILTSRLSIEQNCNFIIPILEALQITNNDADKQFLLKKLNLITKDLKINVELISGEFNSLQEALKQIKHSIEWG